MKTQHDLKDAKYGYITFISYAHIDNSQEGRKWADWLKSKIENFPIPPEFIGTETSLGTVPERIPDVFLDREVLGAGGELTDKLCNALDQSNFLVVICSPNAAKSRYVNLEIEHFIQNRGFDHVIPVVIAGEDSPVGSLDCWIPPSLLGRRKNNELPLYVDFRVMEEARVGSMIASSPGWTDPVDYDAELRGEGRYQPGIQRKLVTDYARSHTEQLTKLIATLIGLAPGQLSRTALVEELQRKKKQLRRLYFTVTANFLVVVMLIVAGLVAYNSYGIAELEREKAERSLRMIGDAHERATHLVADVLADLSYRIESDDSVEVLEGARAIVDQHFEDNSWQGDTPDAMHMRAVALNSRGYLARLTGWYDEAESYFTQALEIRKKLALRDPDKPIYQHNLSICYDNFGDLHVARAIQATVGDDERVSEYTSAAVEYRTSIKILRNLIPDNDPGSEGRWLHDLAVSYFKLGDALFEAGDKEAALEEFISGYSYAEKVAASDLNYPKWQAHLGLYCYQIGRMHALSARYNEAINLFERGKKIFNGLDERGQLNSRYEAWLDLVERGLSDLK